MVKKVITNKGIFEASIKMNALRVKLKDATSNGRLYYTSDPEIEPLVLFIKNPNQRKMAYSINVNGGGMLLALDNHRILQSAEFIIHRRVWKKGIFDTIPEPKIIADIEFSNVYRKYTELDLLITVTTDDAYRYVRIILGEEEPRMEVIGLSDHCYALENSGYLKGFFIKLVR
jgi:hypothetical protein